MQSIDRVQIAEPRSSSGLASLSFVGSLAGPFVGSLAGPLLVSLLVLPLATLALGCGGPLLIVPGGALRGEVVEPSPTDWSFVSDRFIDLEVRPSNPYSVEVNYFVKDGALYIDPAESRRWLEYLREDDRVRVRFSGKVYLLRAVLAGQPGELEGFDADRFVYQLVPRSTAP